MKNNKTTAFITGGGILILGVFSMICAINLVPNGISSDSYYAKVDEDMISTIEKINVENGNLIIQTSGKAESICAKTTKSNPSKNAICWKEVSNNSFSISVFENKTYYVWLKDASGNISSPKEVYTGKKSND